MARTRRDDDFSMDFIDPESKDYSVLLAEADKIRADSRMAVKKVTLLEETEERVRNANDIFKRALCGAPGR